MLETLPDEFPLPNKLHAGNLPYDSQIYVHVLVAAIFILPEF